MALPQNAITVTPYSATFLSPDDHPYFDLENYEQGGIGIGNSSRGRQYQDWNIFIEGNDVYVAPALNLLARTLVFSGAGITTLSLAFDSNMNVVIAFMQSGELKLYWYDTVAGTYTTTTFIGDSGQVSTDDKRETQEGASDVIFAYTRAGTLYYRQQRDRYTVEYTVGATTGYVSRIGMNAINRFQFEVLEPA